MTRQQSRRLAPGICLEHNSPIPVEVNHDSLDSPISPAVFVEIPITLWHRSAERLPKTTCIPIAPSATQGGIRFDMRVYKQANAHHNSCWSAICACYFCLGYTPLITPLHHQNRICFNHYDNYTLYMCVSMHCQSKPRKTITIAAIPPKASLRIIGMRNRRNTHILSIRPINSHDIP